MTDRDTLDDLLGTEGRRRRWWARGTLWASAAAIAVAGVAAWQWAERSTQAETPRYQTQPVTRGTLTVTVTANGTLQPTNQVAIGSELSGTVAQVLVEANDVVRRGQVLAQLDVSRLRDQVASARATLASRQALVRQAQANVVEARENLKRLQEVRRLSGGQVPSASEMSAAEAALARAEATEVSARAAVEESRAALSSAETNLGKASIRSPIDGVVLSRAVDPGNAVAASLQAVTLFTLAEDLKTMKLQVNIDEADVGKVRVGQKATFTVSAYPERRYPATITRVGYGATVKDNVVTYLADLDVRNDDLSLRPGMTATATITTSERGDALLVPNAALRFTPGTEPAAPATNPVVSMFMPAPARMGPPRRALTDPSRARQVWVLRDGQPQPVPVTPGASDGRMTEVASEQLQPGMEVVVGRASGAPR
jgi:HlyD family secretion protein